MMNKAVYIHIPFCKQICSYCDFCKFYFNQELVDKYLNKLKEEVIQRYNGELIKTIYIGGGTPSCLNYDQLDKLFDIINLFNINKQYEFTFECNIEDINIQLLKYLKENKVNRLSIGVQTFNQKLLKFLNRQYDSQAIEKIKLAKQYFNTNVDLIYAIPNQSLKDLEKDLDILIDLDVDHISCYSLIIEEHTKLYINNTKNIDEELDLEMYNLILKKLKHYHHYEISNFAKKGKESKHNLTYWNNDYYYGFGLSSSGYFNNIRYENTRSINHYLNGQYVLESHKLDLVETIQNELILNLRKSEGLSKNKFYDKYHINLKDLDVIKQLLKENKLKENNNYVYITRHLVYTSNEIFTQFLDINEENVL